MNFMPANKASGIDQFHFQPLLKNAFSNALREQLYKEVEELIRGSWMKVTELTENLRQQTAKAKDQLQQLILKIHELYLDQLTEMSTNVWRQTQESILHGVYKANGTVPQMKAFEDWLEVLKGMASEPFHPLKRLIMQHMNEAVKTFGKHEVSSLMEGLAWEEYLHSLKHTLDEAVTKSLDATTRRWKKGLVIDEKIPEHLSEIKASFEDFISELQGMDVKYFLENIEHEMDIFLDSMLFE